MTQILQSLNAVNSVTLVHRRSPDTCGKAGGGWEGEAGGCEEGLPRGSVIH